MYRSIANPETQNRSLEPTGLGRPCKIRELTGMGPGLAHQGAVGRASSWFLNVTELWFITEPELLAGYPDLLLSVATSHHVMNDCQLAHSTYSLLCCI